MPGTERTLVLVKPDGVQRQLVGRILARYEERGLKLAGLKLVRVDRDLAERHYDGAPREAVLRRAGRVHHLRPARRPGPRRPERDRGRPRDQRRDAAARGRAGHDPRRLRARDRAEHRPRLGQPGGRGDRAGAVVRPGRAARLRARHRSLGARPERIGRPGRTSGRGVPTLGLRRSLGAGAGRRRSAARLGAGSMSGLGEGSLAGGAAAAAGPPNAPAAVATASRASSAAIEGRPEGPVGVPRRRSHGRTAVTSGRVRRAAARRPTGSAVPVGPRQPDRRAAARSRRAAASVASRTERRQGRVERQAHERAPRVERRQPREPDAGEDDQHERHGEDAAIAAPSRAGRRPGRSRSRPGPRRPRRECAARDDERQDPASAPAPRPPDRARRTRARRPRHRPRSSSRRCARCRPGRARRRRPGRSTRWRWPARHRAPCRGRPAAARPKRRSRRARRWPARRAPARSAIGSAVSGTTSVRRAAQRWNGIAPKRIATAIANAR